MLPNAVIIGAAKCGTTSMHYYLASHPDIFMAGQKELDFFSGRTWSKGARWYESRFCSGKEVVGESSPSYSKYPLFPNVPEKMYSVVPEAKLIYLVRDPIERIISDYCHGVSSRRESRSIEECLADPESEPIFFCSQYFMQISRFLRFFDRSQILVVALEDLRDHRSECLRSVFDFLGVDETFYCETFSRVFHKSVDKREKNWLGMAIRRLEIANYLRPVLPQQMIDLYGQIAGKPIVRPQLTEEVRAQLIQRLKPDTEQLRELCQKEFSQWCL